MGQACGIKPGVTAAIIIALTQRRNARNVAQREASPARSSMTSVNGETAQEMVHKKVTRIEDKTFHVRQSEKLRVDPARSEPSHENRAAWSSMVEREVLKFSTSWGITVTKVMTDPSMTEEDLGAIRVAAQASWPEEQTHL